MDREERTSLFASLGAVVIASLVAWAGSQGGASIYGLPVYAWCVGIAFLIQWIAFVPAFALRSERFYDLVGSVTYITVACLAVLLGRRMDARSLLLLGLVLIWAGRLGTFLYLRVRKTGRDERFDEIKTSFLRLLQAWTLQGLWVSLTMAAVLAVMTTRTSHRLGPVEWIGLAVWLTGFSIEAIADEQKRRFRASPENRGRFISSGLWRWSRHPNYFGEIVLWIGVSVIAIPVLSGWRWVALISPVFVTLLITKVSGIPILERRADDRWGGQEIYEDYKRRTSVLIPRPPAP